MENFDITSSADRVRVGRELLLTKAQRECLARVGVKGWAFRASGCRSYGSEPDFSGSTLASLVQLGLVEYQTQANGRTRQDIVVPVGWSAAHKAQADRRLRVQEATLYVTSRFYPPLPREYGELLVQAHEAVLRGRPEEQINLPFGINPKPRTAIVVEDDAEGREQWAVTAEDLLITTRCEHLLHGEDEF